MQDTTSTDSQVDEAIRELARAHDFPLAGLREAGEVLVLEPTSPEALPDAAALRALANSLKDRTGHRYVTVEAAAGAGEDSR